jgi:hypothetical protein
VIAQRSKSNNFYKTHTLTVLYQCLTELISHFETIFDLLKRRTLLCAKRFPQYGMLRAIRKIRFETSYLDHLPVVPAQMPGQTPVAPAGGCATRRVNAKAAG